MKKHLVYLLFISIFFFFAGNEKLTAQDEQPSANDVAAKLNNPSAAIGSINTFVDLKTYKGSLPGADEQTSWSLTFQPSLPKPLGQSGYNLLLRPAIPVIFSQPVYKGTHGFVNSGIQLGNVGFDLVLGTTTKKGLLILSGMVGTLPTATSEDIRAQWAFGPELALGLISKKLIIGALITQQWDVESGPDKTSIFGGQYFYFIPLGNGRTIGAAPSYSYNWISEEWNFPLGFGYSTVTKFGEMPFKYGLFAFYNVATPDAFGQAWQIRIQLTPVVKLPWK